MRVWEKREQCRLYFFALSVVSWVATALSNNDPQWHLEKDACPRLDVLVASQQSSCCVGGQIHFDLDFKVTPGRFKWVASTCSQPRMAPLKYDKLSWSWSVSGDTQPTPGFFYGEGKPSITFQNEKAGKGQIELRVFPQTSPSFNDCDQEIVVTFPYEVKKLELDPPRGEASVSCQDVEYTLLNNDQPENVVWAIQPANVKDGASLTSDGNKAIVHPGSLKGSYTVKASLKTDSSCAASAALDVVEPEIMSLDCLEKENTVNHHTDAFSQENFVLRRGQKFTVEVVLSKDYNPECHDVWFQATRSFDVSAEPLDIPLVKEDGPVDSWYCKIVSITENEDKTKTCRIDINIPAQNTAVGRYTWRMNLGPHDKPEVIYRATHFSETVVLLFNPWSPQDDVYLPSEEDRSEYALQTVGAIWRGNITQQIPKLWRFAQFNEFAWTVVDSKLDALDSEERASPINVALEFVDAIRFGNNPIIEAKWASGANAYADGRYPGDWSGSDEILEEYLSHGKTTKYAQCYVYGGLLTTFLRCVGIPARPITNFESGYDENENKTIDRYYEMIEGSWTLTKTETIWNFHVWCDAWMKRPDQINCDGWQAVDATFATGPASVESIKSDSGSEYDNDFIYAAVSGDVVTYIKRKGSWARFKTEHGKTGLDIITRKINTQADPQSIIDQYKVTPK